MAQSFLFMGIFVLSAVSAQLCLKKGVLKLESIFRIFNNGWIMLGLFLFGISFFSWILVLSRMHLNIAYPVVTGINFSLIAISSRLLFKEYLSFRQVLGMVFVVFGIFLVLSKGFI